MRSIYFSLVFLVCFFQVESIDELDKSLPECTQDDFHYEYTTCDSEGERWRVSVPTPDTCVGGRPPAPVRGQYCDFTCEAGEYLDIATDQECHKCPAGHFSLGGGVLYDVWNVIPQGFTSRNEIFAEYEYSDSTHCTEAGWTPRGKYIATNNSECIASLVYSANLVREGSVTFTYRFFESKEDTVFTFEVENGQCQTKSKKPDVQYLETTDSDQWKSVTYELKAGLNFLSWRVYTLSLVATVKHVEKIIALASVEINGVAFTSNCTECEAGSFSSRGASICEPCPVNTYSKRGAAECLQCDAETQYSGSGSSECLSRPRCTEDHYIMYYTPCVAGNTRKKYKWIEPKLCRAGVQLPEDGIMEQCPPCNVGMQLVNGVCEFCKRDEYSDGKVECQPCPGSTTPETGVVYKQWGNLPKNANITTRCMSLRETGNNMGCVTEEGWAVFSNYIRTVSVNADDVFSVLSLQVGGFRSSADKTYRPDVSAVPNGEVSFLFDSVCSSDCEFIFFMQEGKEKTQVIDSWDGVQTQKAYKLPIFTESPVKLSWAFRKSARSSHVSRADDHVKVYMINVTNTLSGGAETCKRCPQGASSSGCIPCPSGHYIDGADFTCKSCPNGTVAHSGLSWGIDSCVKCSSGLVPLKGQRCVSHCTYQSPDKKNYNFTKLARINLVQGPRLFTSTGHAYFHLFNISICGNNDDYEMAYCNQNMTSSVGYSSKTVVGVTANICQRTILLSQDKSEPIVSVSPMSIGSSLVGITNIADDNMTKLLAEAGFMPKSENEWNNTQDIYMKYTSDTPTAACPPGRTVTVVLRCAMEEQDQARAELPPLCGDGTCDGCNFIFMIKSPLACPICESENIEQYMTPCTDGVQSTIKKTKLPCNVQGSGIDLSPITKKCTAFWQDQWPLWLKVVIILVPVVLISGVILFTVVISCWIKNKNLQYKYMKLIESSTGKYSEMPAPETCALDEGEDEEEQFDAVKVRKGTKFFSKLRLSQKRGANKMNNDDGDEDEDSFESMRMTDKTSLT